MSEEGQIRKCTVIGNGETLRNFDLTKIKDETIGVDEMNIYRNTDIYPDYYVCVNEDVIQSYHAEIRKMIQDDKCKSGYLLSKKILIEYPDLSSNEKIIFLEDFQKQRGNPFQYLVSCTSESVAVLFAVILGFNDIHILGVDTPDIVAWEHIVFVLTGYTRLNNLYMNVTCWTDDEVEGVSNFFHKENIKDYFLEDI